MTKHTVGPWHVVDGRWIMAEVPEWEAKVARVERVGWGGECDKTEANARLLAAAPELLEALETLRDMIDSFDEKLLSSGRDKMDAAEAAIKKARGGGEGE